MQFPKRPNILLTLLKSLLCQIMHLSGVTWWWGEHALAWQGIWWVLLAIFRLGWGGGGGIDFALFSRIPRENPERFVGLSTPHIFNVNIKIAQKMPNSWNFIVGCWTRLLKKWQTSAIIQEISYSTGHREVWFKIPGVESLGMKL